MMFARLNLIRRDILGYFKRLHLRAELQNSSLFLAPTAIFNGSIDDISFGTGCTIGHYAVIDITNDPTSQHHGARVTLSDFVYIGESCNIRAAGAHIRIGKNTMIANGVIIVGSNHLTEVGLPIRLQPWDFEGSGVTIGEDCWIGAGSIVLPGCEIGDGTIVAAGAVARGKIQAGSIVGGVPARLIRMRS
jgi:acetyltransferase-like isoleucine patch superfamily enzyme